jgi:hypothetical protein
MLILADEIIIAPSSYINYGIPRESEIIFEYQEQIKEWALIRPEDIEHFQKECSLPVRILEEEK